MKNNFLQEAYGGLREARSKHYCLGLPRKWKVMTSTLLLLFTFAIGNVWADETYYLQDPAKTNGTPALTGDFHTTASLNFTVNKAYDAVTYKNGLTFSSNINGSTSNMKKQDAWVRYDCQSTETDITILVYANSNSKKFYYWTIAENATIGSESACVVSSVSGVDATNGSIIKKDITISNETRTSLYVSVGATSNVSIVQIIATEKGTKFPKPGEAGYSINFNHGRYAAASGTLGKLDYTSATTGIEMHMSADYYYTQAINGSLKTNNTNYIKFAVPTQPVVLGFTTNNNKKYTVGAKGSTTNPITPTANAQKAIKITTTDALYINPQESSVQPTGMVFYIPTISYDKNDEGANGTMSSNTWTVVANGFTAPSGKKFDKWNTKADGSGDDVAVGNELLENTTLYAQWKADVAEYTVTYKDGESVLKSVSVACGNTPDAYTPTKEFYTFANWDVDPSTLGSTPANTEVVLNASWTTQYTSGTYEFTGHLTMGTAPNQMTIANSSDGSNYDAGRIDNIYVSAQKIGYQNDGGDYDGWKLKTTNGTLRFLVENACGVRVTLGEANPLRIAYTEGGVAKTADIAKSTTSAIYKADANSLVTLTNFTASNKTVTLKKIEILPLYDATLTDTKSDGSDSKPSVTEVTLPTPTAVSGWTYTGWIANQDVKDSEDNTKTAGTILSAGKYTLLANTTFTAQWVEASATYDITYSSAHGTAPIAENAASVVLTELSEEGWAHKGWTANEDVTVDAATVNAGDLIENGKTVILAGDVTFTAVWKEIFTVTFDSKDGSAVAPVDVEDGASLAAAPTAPTKDNYVFLGWSETDGGPVVADITTLTIGADKTLYAKWALDVQVTELVFSNSFKGWINGSNITVFYMAGESAPTIVSYEGKNLKAADAVAIVGDEVVATGSDDSEKHYTLTMTAVSPLTATGEQTFDGSETYVKTRHAWTSDRKWKMSKDGTDGRVPRGDCSMYFFLGAAESVTFNWGKQQKTEDVAVYVNGTFVKNIGKDNNSAISLTGGNNMVAFYSLQTSGDIWLNGLTVVAYVPTTGVTLKEGEDPISSKTIWESTNFTLTATVTPDNASDKTITWTSSDDAIATVANGVVTGVAANATPVTITATTVDGVSATCVVTVTAAPAPCETPVIGTQPAGVAYCAGSEPTLTVAASVGEGTLHYAWFKDDAAIGTDAATCLVNGAGTYKVVVTNHVDGKLDASVTSDEAVVTLNVAAAITTQPTNKSEIVSGSSVTLSLVATNATSYQWYSCDDAEKTNAAAIAGAEADDYEFTCTANGYYYCAVGNACGDAILSNVVSVKLEPEGCNTLASIPTEAPYQYEQAGKWTLYCVNSDGTLLNNNKFTDEGKDFDGNSDVNALLDKRFAIKFAKDVESVTIYAEGGTGRTFSNVYISSEMTKNTYAELTGITKQMVNAETNRQYILTVAGIIPADQYAWFELSGSLGVFKICYTEALARPVIPTLSNQELCSGESYAEIDATSTKTGEGTLSYQWYDATDEEHPVVIDGANSATFTPTADGKYYVEVTNAAAGHVSNKAKSNTITMAHFASAAITTAPENVRMDAGQNATLTVVASGKNLSYEWFTCDDEMGTNPVAIVPAETNASLAVTVTAGMNQYYKVVVYSDCGNASAVALVEEWHELPQVPVSATTTWDWQYAATTTIAPEKDVEILMANIKDGVKKMTNDETFNSQALLFQGQEAYIVENSRAFAKGGHIKFTTTVPGMVTVEFSDNGNNNRKLKINDAISPESSSSKTDVKTFSAIVPAGEVMLEGVNGDGTGNDRYIRISKIIFDTNPDLADADYTRDVTEGRYGTICLPNGGVMIGAELFEIAYYGATSEKIFFDNIPSGEMEAGIPYIFLPKAGVSQLGVFYTDAANVSPAGNHNGLYGSYTQEIITPNVGNYILLNNQYCEVVTTAEPVYVGANRAYIKLADISPTEPALAPGRRRISMGVQSQNAATGMDELNASETPVKMLIDGQLFILRGEKMYNANGQLVK